MYSLTTLRGITLTVLLFVLFCCIDLDFIYISLHLLSNMCIGQQRLYIKDIIC